jgi:serine protease inhibitor ecotin
VHCGMNLETFTIHGWGYHLHDIIIMARTLD